MTVLKEVCQTGDFPKFSAIGITLIDRAIRAFQMDYETGEYKRVIRAVESVQKEREEPLTASECIRVLAGWRRELILVCRGEVGVDTDKINEFAAVVDVLRSEKAELNGFKF